MRKHSPLISTLAPAVAAVLLAGTGQAQVTSLDREGQIDRSFEASTKNCADVRWSQTAQQAFPGISSACQAVEQRNGKSYVKFEGTVEEVEQQGKRLVVDFEDGGELAFAPPAQTVLYMDGERTSFADVPEGTRLNFYVPEDRLQAELQPDPQRVAFIIFPLDLGTIGANERSGARTAQDDRNERRDAMTARNETTAMDELPSTAGPLPLIGLGGVGLLLVGAMARSLRRRRRD